MWGEGTFWRLEKNHVSEGTAFVHRTIQLPLVPFDALILQLADADSHLPSSMNLTLPSASLVLLLHLFSVSSFGQVELLRDLNLNVSSFNDEFRQLTNGRNQMYFVLNGRELWKSNGTTATTVRLKVFDAIGQILPVGNTLYFAASSGSGMELWRSNGSASSTVLVADIFPGGGGSNPESLTALNGVLFFSATTAQYGRELWRSDGTETGTRMVKDILRVRGSSNPRGLVAHGEHIFFSANDGASGIELWKSDGTAAGTVMVADIRPEFKTSSSPSLLVSSNGVLFFKARDAVHGEELWKSDGTPAGTMLVRDVRPGTSSSGIENMIDVNGKLFFTADDGVHGDELWRSDGTSGVTALVKDINAGRAGSNNRDPYFGAPMGNFSNMNGVLYFTASLGYDDYIFRSDGTANGTIALRQCAGVGINDPQPAFTFMDGFVYFIDGEGGHGPFYLMRIPVRGFEITLLQPLVIPDDYYVTHYHELLRFNKALYLFGIPANESGFGFIRSDGEGTRIIKRLITPTLGSYPENFTAANGFLFFNTFPYDGVGEPEVYRTDGTSSGTIKLGDGSFNTLLRKWGDKVVYYSNDFIYASDGHPENTTGHFARGVNLFSSVTEITPVQDKVIYETNRREIWKTDFTTSNGTLLGTLNFVNQHIPQGNEVYLLERTIESGLKLWRTDGVALQPVKVIRESPASGSSVPVPATSISSTIYFVANDGVHGDEVWQSNGTPDGTRMTFDLRQSGGSSDENDVAALANFQGRLYISAIGANGFWQLFRANGQSFETFASIGRVFAFITLSDKLFVIHEQDQQLAVSVTDGTVNGTRTIITQPFTNYPEWTSADEVLYVKAAGSELIRTDGTPCGTFTINLGIYQYQHVTAFNDDLIFSAPSPGSGDEPHILRNITQFQPACFEQSDVRVAESKSKMSYPNPFVHEFRMQVPGAPGETAELCIRSMQGELMEVHRAVNCSELLSGFGATLQPGMYIIDVKTTHGVFTETIIKK